MNKTEILNLFRSLTIWKKGGQRAPNKPLLLLYALGQLRQSGRRMIPFTEIEAKLNELLAEFGPSRRKHTVADPFWRLQNDSIWQVLAPEEIPPQKDSYPPLVSALRKANPQGGFADEIYALLRRDPNAFREVVNIILSAHFPETLHADILQSVGLDPAIVTGSSGAVEKRSRDPEFRVSVIRAYEYSCAVCGFSIHLGKTPIAIEAAHIKWHQAGGPDEIGNGIALCALHHKLFDYGAFTLNQGMILKVSEDAHGSGKCEWLMAFHNKEIRRPVRTTYRPNEEFALWHFQEVFKGEMRE